MITAGEASGDRLGAGLARALLARRPDLQLVGMGGERMSEAGVEILQDASTIAVVGIFEVLAHLPAIRGAMALLEKNLDDARPDLLVPIDFPDFNLRLAARARKRDVDVVYFVSPQVWAWRKRRVHTIRKLVRRMLVLFPFETGFYRDAGVPVTFVGHPIAEEPPAAAPDEELRTRIGLDPRHRTVALMPGSRRIEIERLLPTMLAAARRLEVGRDDLQFLIPTAPGVTHEDLRRYLVSDAPQQVHFHAGDFPRVLALCEAGVVASGTASLEAAASGLPVVVVYRVSTLSYMVGRALVRLENIALPNLVAGRRVVPELIQGECTPEAIESRLAVWLDDPQESARVRSELREIRRTLGGPGLYDRAAEAILGELEAAGS